MNPAQVHLLLNHLPVVGAPFAAALLIIGALMRSADVRKVGYWALIALAIITVPTYLSGDPAHEFVDPFPGTSHELAEQHEQAAQIALIATVVLGLGVLAGLIAFRRAAGAPVWFHIAALVLAVGVSGVMAWTAHLGGQVRHEEIRPGAKPPENAVGHTHEEEAPTAQPAATQQQTQAAGETHTHVPGEEH
jgi:uncharacterized membrane protein